MLTLLPRFPVRVDLPMPEAPAQGVAVLIEPRVNGLTRGQIMDRIVAMNPSASIEFLEGFASQDLSDYLDHLTAAALPRGRDARWVRPDNTRGISWSARRS